MTILKRFWIHAGDDNFKNSSNSQIYAYDSINLLQIFESSDFGTENPCLN